MDLIECGRIEDAGRYPGAGADEWPRQRADALAGQHLFPPRRDSRRRPAAIGRRWRWDPRTYAPHLSLAKLAIQRRRRDEALQQLNQARLLAPRQYGVLYNLASVYRQLGLTSEADGVQAGDPGAAHVGDRRPGGHQKGAWPRYAL